MSSGSAGESPGTNGTTPTSCRLSGCDFSGFEGSGRQSSVARRSVAAPSPHDKLRTRESSGDGRGENEDGGFLRGRWGSMQLAPHTWYVKVLLPLDLCC